MKKTPILYILFTAIAILLSFTSFYSVGYLVLIVLFALSMRFSGIFSSLFSKIVVSALLLLATTMIIGLASWFLHLITYPLTVMVAYSLLGVALNFRRRAEPRSKAKFFESGDLVSLGIALIVPTIVAISYFIPYSNTALYQLVSNGWDNTAHVVMLETASTEKTFVYGQLEDVQAKTINKTNAYPQAWHLATSNFANGFGKNLFQPQFPIMTLKWYVIIMATWFIIGAFLVSKTAWVLTKRIREKTAMPMWLYIGLFVLLNVIAQLLAGAGSMLNGFANYLGILAYVALLVSFIVDANFKQPSRSLSLATIIAGTAGILCWFLPFPAIIFSVLLLVLLSKPSRTFRGFIMGNKSIMALSAALVALIVAQVIIFVKFTKESGAELLITSGGAYKVSEMLIGILVLATGVYLFKKQPELFRKFLIATIPLILMVTGIYIYQLVISEELTYYYYKLTMMLGMIIMIFAIPALLVGFEHLFKRLNGSKGMALIVFPTLIGLSLLITQQTLRPFHFLLQSNSNVSFATAGYVARYLENEDPNKTKLIVMTDRSRETPARDENFNGDIVTTVSHLPYTCAYYVYNNLVNRSFYAALGRLERCATNNPDLKIQVITNDKTYWPVKSLNKSNIEVFHVQ